MAMERLPETRELAERSAFSILKRIDGNGPLLVKPDIQKFVSLSVSSNGSMAMEPTHKRACEACSWYLLDCSILANLFLLKNGVDFRERAPRLVATHLQLLYHEHDPKS